MLVKQRIQTIAGVVAALLVTAVVSVYLFSAIAQAEDVKTNPAANTLRVSPVRSDVEVMPGETGTVPVTVSNLTNATVFVHPSSNDFVATDESGTPGLILNENEYAPSHSLKRFMGPLADISIPAGQAKTVNVVITVPKDARPGGYFGAIRFAPTDPDGGGQVNMSASVASLILLTVPGDVKERIELTNFDILQSGVANSNFRDGDNLAASFRFKNDGDIQIGPFGKLTVKKGDTVVFESDFNTKQPREVILPDSARRWNIPLDGIDGFGHYTVLATFTYGKTNQTIEVTKAFWVVPWFVIIIAGVLVLLLIGAIVATIFLIRRRKHRPKRKKMGFGTSR